MAIFSPRIAGVVLLILLLFALCMASSLRADAGSVSRVPIAGWLMENPARNMDVFSAMDWKAPINIRPTDFGRFSMEMLVSS